MLIASSRRVSMPGLSAAAVSTLFHGQKDFKGALQINSWHSNKYADLSDRIKL